MFETVSFAGKICKLIHCFNEQIRGRDKDMNGINRMKKRV
jgi:hypothetical protein